MNSMSTLRIHRRALLSGIAASLAVAVVAPAAVTVFDRIVMRDGWLLKESDLT